MNTCEYDMISPNWRYKRVIGNGSVPEQRREPYADFLVRFAISLVGTNVRAPTASIGLGGGEPDSRPAKVPSRSLISWALPSIGISEIMQTSSTDAASASAMSCVLRSSLV